METLPLDFIPLVLRAVIWYGLAAVAGYYIIKGIAPRLKLVTVNLGFLGVFAFTDAWIRVLAGVVTSLIAISAWLILVWLGEMSLPEPNTLQNWVLYLGAICGVSTGLNQWLHGFMEKNTL